MEVSMSEIITSMLNRYFIGTVKAYDASKRTVDVFIPKLMGLLPESRADSSSLTDCGKASIDIKYNKTIKTSVVFTARAEDKDASMPDIGSKVRIRFIDGIITNPIWSKFNINGDYKIIDSEKYPKQFSFKIGEKQIDVNSEDTINIVLPEGCKVIELNDKNDSKKKTFTISFPETLETRLKLLEDAIGIMSYTRTYKTSDGNNATENIPATGIYKKLEDLQEEIKNLN